MKNLIATRQLHRYLDVQSYGRWFAPFFGVAAKYTAHSADRARAPRWVWHDADAISECLPSTWDMLGGWSARRAVAVRRSAFDRWTPGPLRDLALCFNRYDVNCLSDLARSPRRTYARVFPQIVSSVLDLSRVKRTARVEPMFGSKVAHHFFPSVVPVFDTAMIRRGVICTAVYRQFQDRERDEWLPTELPRGGEEYASYLAFLTAQVAGAPERALEQTRRAFGRAVEPFAPMAMVRAPKSHMWLLDAKIAEACACGEARREGLL